MGVINVALKKTRRNFNWEKEMNRKNVLAAGSVILIIVIIFLFEIWISNNYLVVKDYKINVKNENPFFTAVVISDLHDHQFKDNNEQLVRKIEQTQPDIVLMVGDMLNAGSEDSSVPCSLIEQVSESAPVYYALGNHEKDYMENNHSPLIKELERAGAVVLEKSYVDIEINGSLVRLGGMYDYAFGLDGDNTAMSAPEDILAFLEDFQNTDRVKIMLSHRPDSFIFGDASEVWDIDLVISGHNHGGQVVLPFLGGLYGGDQGWFPTYVHGLYEKGNLQLFITSGLGSDRQKLPRFNNPPEVAVLVIE